MHDPGCGMQTAGAVTLPDAMKPAHINIEAGDKTMTQDYGGRLRKIGRRGFCAGVAAATAAAVAPSLSRAARVSDAAAFYVAVGATLTVYRPDTQAQTLRRDSQAVLPEAVQYAWAHPALPLLYVAFSNRYSTKADDHHGVAVLRIDQTTGRLSPFGEPLILKNRPVNVTLDPKGQYLLVAYNAPSDLTVHPLAADGAMGEAVTQHHAIDAGIYAHQVRVAPDDRTVVLPTRGNDATASKPEDAGALKVFRLEDGQLTGEQSVAPHGGFGFGPRHVDFHPAKPWMYVSMERENQLQMFDLKAGRLAPQARFIKTTLASPNDVHPQQLAGPIHVSRNGRLVYVANRADATTDFDGKKVFAGGENCIAVFRIDQKTGEPVLIQTAATDSFHPRTFSIHPDGRMLVSAAIEPLDVRDGNAVRTVSAALSVFQIASEGRLRNVRKYDIETGPDWMFWCGMVPLRSDA
jgi:6-phosphogluconolactonase